MTTQPPQSESLIEYPCRFPIKVMGAQHPEFVDAIVSVAQQFEPEFDATTVSINTSKGGNYVGLTLAVWVTHREQLDNLYRALTGHPMVKVVL
ncbi:MAG: hypothetical protein RL357_489 [Pseudomonadota bacterium]|jgi:hypothetical protein